MVYEVEHDKVNIFSESLEISNPYHIAIGRHG